MVYPRTYEEALATNEPLDETKDWNPLVLQMRGFTPSGTFKSPYSFVIITDGTYFYACNAFQVVYGGPYWDEDPPNPEHPGSGNGVDGTDLVAVVNTVLAIPNSTVIIAPGNYLVTDSLVITEDYVDLEISKGAILTLDDGLDVAIIKAENVENIKGHGAGYLDGNKTNQSPGEGSPPLPENGGYEADGVLFYNVTDSEVSGLTLVNMRNCGVRIKADSHRNKVFGNTFSGCGQMAISCLGTTYNDAEITPQHHMIITGNHISACYEAGISLHRCFNSVVTDNICLENGDGGIVLEIASDIVIDGNVCNGNFNWGICAENASERCIISNNQCEENTKALAAHLPLIGEITQAETPSGITVNGGDDTIVSGNFVSDNNRGIYVYGAAHVNVSDNIIIDNTVGIQVDTATSPTIEGNTVSGSHADPAYTGFGIYIMNTDVASVCGNTLYGNTGTNIRLFNDNYCSVTANTASGGIGGIYLLDSCFNTVADNTLSGNGDADGIYVIQLDAEPSLYNIIKGNEISSQQRAGIYIENANFSNISHNTIVNVSLKEAGVYNGITIVDSQHCTLVGDKIIDPKRVLGGEQGAPYPTIQYGILEDGTSNFNTYSNIDTYTIDYIGTGLHIIGASSKVGFSWSGPNWVP
jgi:parallel beta-helix repeat protein